MPDIHINRGGQSFGPYPEDVARQHLEAGSLLPTDLAWHEGADGWKPLSEVLAPPAPQPAAEEPPPPPPPDGEATDGAPPPPDGDASGTPPPPDGDSSDSPPPPDDGGDKDTIHVPRRGDAIGPYPRAMASEYFTGGSLLPTDWGWHEGMEEWKPLYEVLDLPVPDQPVFNPAMAPQRGGGKGKKIAKIAGLAVLAIGLIAAGILYGPKLLGLLGGGKIDTPEELAERTIKALKDNDQDAMLKLTVLSFSESDLKLLADDVINSISDSDVEPLAKLTGKSVEDWKKEIRKKMEEEMSDEEERETALEKISSGMEEIIKSAEDDGVGWSDVTIGDVDTSGLEKGGPFSKKTDASESELQKGRVLVYVTSKGKEFVLRINCMYTPSLGWFMDDAPRWQGPKRD